MKFTIVFADNQRGIRRYCKHGLEDDGHRVLLADDGDDTLTVVETFAIDLVIVDEFLPPSSGLEVAGHLKEINPRLPVILFTSIERQGDLSRLPVDAMIARSEDLTALRRAVRALLPAEPGLHSRPVESQEEPEELDWVFDELQSQAAATDSALSSSEFSSEPELEITNATAKQRDGYQPLGV